MKVEMSLPIIAKLVKQGILAPSDINCLDEQSKQELKQLCLELCKPNQCAQCDAQSYCAKEIGYDAAHHKLVEFKSL